MEAIIRTDDKTSFYSLIQFLKTLYFQVETKEEKKVISNGKRKNDFSQAVKFWNSINVDMRKLKLNREDAYER